MTNTLSDAIEAAEEKKPMSAADVTAMQAFILARHMGTMNRAQRRLFMKQSLRKPKKGAKK